MAVMQDFYTMSGAPGVYGTSQMPMGGVRVGGQAAYQVGGQVGAGAAAGGGAVVVAIAVLIGAFLLLHTR